MAITGARRLGLLSGRAARLHSASKPVENAFFSESLNGRLRDECVTGQQFTSMAEAQDLIEAWRFDDNQRRPQRSLGHLTPTEFAGQRQALLTIEEAVCSSEELSRNGANVNPVSSL